MPTLAVKPGLTQNAVWNRHRTTWRQQRDPMLSASLLEANQVQLAETFKDCQRVHGSRSMQATGALCSPQGSSYSSSCRACCTAAPHCISSCPHLHLEASCMPPALENAGLSSCNGSPGGNSSCLLSNERWDGIYLRYALDVNARVSRSAELGYCQVSREVVVLLSVKQACLMKSGPYGPRHSAQLGEPHILGNINEEHLRHGAQQGSVTCHSLHILCKSAATCTSHHLVMRHRCRLSRYPASSSQ